jgi:transcriptional regulator with XRE-family HTH domain
LLRTLVGDVLRRNRLGQRRTLADVARSARVSTPYLSEVERGRKEASSEVLAAVCDALGIGLVDLLAEVGRDLMVDNTPVVRLDSARQRRDSAGQHSRLAGQHSRLAGQHSTRRDTTLSTRRPGDVLLLAA